MLLNIKLKEEAHDRMVLLYNPIVTFYVTSFKYMYVGCMLPWVFTGHSIHLKGLDPIILNPPF